MALAVFSGTALLAAGCAVSPPLPRVPPSATMEPSEAPSTAAFRRLAADLSTLAPDAAVIAVPVDYGSPATPVTRMSVDDRVLFETGSDRPGGNAAAVLDAIVRGIRQRTPDAQVTVVGHTDAVGSDDYNIDLSRRRGLEVARLLADRGVPRDRLSVVAIGKRQPVASNQTPEGRARNRRVEFLISPDIAANLRAVSATPADPAYALAAPAPVLRLDPYDAPQTRSPRPGSSTRAVSPGAVRVGAAPVRPSTPGPAPHYDARPLAPEVQPNTLGSEKAY